jgi:hypothetical protein
VRIAIICNKTGTDQDVKHSGIHFQWGFEDLGDRVDVYHWKEQDKIPLEYDFYFSVDSSEEYGIQERLRPLIVYNGDTHMPGGLQRDMTRCRNADLIFNGNYENGVELMRLMGFKSIWLPLGYDRRFDFKDEDLKDKPLDVAMIGHANSGERVALWEMLKKNYNCEVGDLDPAEIYKKSKIVVNQPTEPWNNIYNNRLIEGMISGCVVLQKNLTITSYKRVIDTNLITFWNDFSDLKWEIDRILNSWEIEGLKGYLARTSVKENYSYRNLCTIIKNYYLNLGEIEKNGKI